MKKILFALVLVILLVLGSSCNSTGTSKRAGERRVQDEYHTGTKGIEMDFLKNAPPNRVYEGNPLELIVELRNEGAYPQTDSLEGRLFVSGFSEAAINGEWDGGNDMPTNLIGKNQLDPEGAYDTMTYKDADGVHVPFSEQDMYESRIMVTSCYKYKTIADLEVCIDPHPYEVVQEEKVCNIDDAISTGAGQGAPVEITNVNEEVGADRVRFEITLRNTNRDNGQVILLDAYENCPFDTQTDEIDRVLATIKLPYDTSPDCNPRGTSSDPIRLSPTTGTGKIFCDFSIPDVPSAYRDTLHIELGYVYSSHIKKDVDILRLR